MPARSYDILVVDDQVGVRRLICEALMDEGFLVEQAANGREALEKLRLNKINLILLDIKMPGINGLEALSEIRKIDSNVAVIMMTAYGELDLMEEASKKGAKDHISKPFDLDDLKSIVRRYLPNKDSKSENAV